MLLNIIVANTLVSTFILLLNLHIIACFEPLTMGAAVVGFGAYSINFLKDHTYCRYTECCTENYIPADVEALGTRLQKILFGQHILQQHLIPALAAHLSTESKSRKPLVISFHGTPGTGKNFVAEQIAKALYKNGMESKFVHKFMGRVDFPLASQVHVYKELINREVREGIASCPQSLYIFDEVDKMPSGIFESLTSLVDYNATPLNKKSIFLFLSNAAGPKISDTLGRFIKEGTLREDTKLSDFELLLQSTAYKVEGGMKQTGLIEAHVIDHYIPFLPLEKSHVKKCLEAEFRHWAHDPDPDVINDIIKSSVAYERTHGLFALSGCKTLEKKVAVAIKIKAKMANNNIT